MNVPLMTDYLSQVAPVPFNPDSFRFGERIEAAVSDVQGYRSYRITVNGKRVYKPHAEVITNGRGDVLDAIRDVRIFDVRGPRGASIGKGWYADTSLLAAFPPTVLMRGIRVRHGNIGVGDEYFLADCYTERRFATWHIGEIHLDSSITPNARRDGFEHCPACESFLEHASALGKHLSKLCRVTSKKRSAASHLNRCLTEVENFTASEYFLDAEHFERRRDAAEKALANVLLAVEDGHSDDVTLKERCFTAKATYETRSWKPILVSECLDGRKMRSLSNRQLLLDVCRRLATSENGEVTRLGDIIEAIKPYLKV